MGRLREEDFAVLREPLESGRQSRESISVVLILGIFLQALMFALNYYLAAPYSLFPFKEEIINIHFWLTVTIIGLSIVYSIPFVYKRSERIQYALSILVSHNVGSISFLIISLFTIGLEDEGMTNDADTLMQIAYVILAVALLLFIIIMVRYYISLKKGHYRKGSKKEEQRNELANMSFVPKVVLIGGAVFILITKWISHNSNYYDSSTPGILVLGMIVFYAMIAVLPEQLIILYCKCKYKSFNFSERGYLYSIGEQKTERRRKPRIEA